MAKDYFQDITPPGEPDARAGRGASRHNDSGQDPASGSAFSSPQPPPGPSSPVTPVPDQPERTIRNIPVAPTRRPRAGAIDLRDTGAPISPPRAITRYWMWGGVALSLLVLGAIGLVALRPTTVTVIPRSHTVVFDETAQFSAYPAATAKPNALSFTLESSTLEDSQLVPAKGMERVEERAQGTIVVYNEYSAQPVKLIKNTRFQTPEGLIFRIPAEVIVPGRKGAVPGSLSVMAIADAPGEKYNVGPVSRFTIPGLKSSADMYKQVYARSHAPIGGGFSGERPAAEPGAIEAARSQMRTRLQEKARAAALARTDDTTFAFSDLARITYESAATETEKGGIRLHERARIEQPLFPSDAFAHIIAQSVSAEAERGSIGLRTGKGFAARRQNESAPLGDTAPLEFTLRGEAQLVWKVNVSELAAALAGRDESAFRAIVEGFPGIDEAHARIEPFWNNTFPKDPAAIHVTIQEPKATL